MENRYHELLEQIQNADANSDSPTEIYDFIKGEIKGDNQLSKEEQASLICEITHRKLRDKIEDVKTNPSVSLEDNTYNQLQNEVDTAHDKGKLTQNQYEDLCQRIKEAKNSLKNT